MGKTGVIVCGSKGRMGAAIISVLKERELVYYAAGVDSGYVQAETGPGAVNAEAPVFAGLEDAIISTNGISSRVIIDFTSASASVDNAKKAAAAGIPIVIGSTGFSPSDAGSVVESAKSAPIVLSGNMSLGINVLLNAVYGVSGYLGSAYDCEIIETHHNKKKDAPSGTAKMLAESVAKQRNVGLSEKAVYVRYGDAAGRKNGEIGIFSVRAGDVIGEHRVIFAGNEEIIEIKHTAISRNNFARGAVRAAEWLIGKKNGFYDMRDVLGLPKNE